MKKTGVLVMGMTMFLGCNNSSTLENKADSLGKEVDSSSERTWDSGKKDMKELKERIEDRFNEKDSAEN
jgi:hypothetical protein